MKVFNSDKMELISVGGSLRLFVIVSVFCLLGVNCSRMWSSFDKRQLSAEKKRCLSPCKIFHSWCKNDGKCREKGPDCSWYCECPDNCEGFFCEKVIENVDGKNKTTVKIKAQVVRETEKQTFSFDKSKLEQALASIYQKNKETGNESGKPAEPKPIQRVGKTIKVKENITVTGTLYCPPGKINEDLQNKTSEAAVSTSTSTDVSKNVSLKNDSSTSIANSTKSTSVTKISISELMRKNQQAAEGSKSTSKPGPEAAKKKSKSEAYLQNKRVLKGEINGDQRQTFSTSSGSKLFNTTNARKIPTENVTLSVESNSLEASTRSTTTYIQNKTSSDSSPISNGSTIKPLTSQTNHDTVTSQTTLKSTLDTKKDEHFITIDTTSFKPVMSQTVSNFTSTSAGLTTGTTLETTNTVQSTRKQTVGLTSTMSPVINVQKVASSKSKLDLTGTSTVTSTSSTAHQSQHITNLEPKLISTTQTIQGPTKYLTSTMRDTEAFLHPNKMVPSSSTTVDPSPLVASTELPRKQTTNTSLTNSVTANQTTAEGFDIKSNTDSNFETTSAVGSSINHNKTASSTGSTTSSITIATTTQTPSTTEIFTKKEPTTQGKGDTHPTTTSVGSSATSSKKGATSQTASASETLIKNTTMTSNKDITHIIPTSTGSSDQNSIISTTTPQTTIATETLSKDETTTPRKDFISIMPTSIGISTANSKISSTTPLATSTTELLSKNETTTKSKNIDHISATSKGNTNTSITSATTTKRTSITEMFSKNETTTHFTGVMPHKTTKMNENTRTTFTPYTRSVSNQSTSSISILDTSSTANLSTTTEQSIPDQITKIPLSIKSAGISVLKTTVPKQIPVLETTTFSDTNKTDIITTTLPSTSDEASATITTSGILNTHANLRTILMKSTTDSSTSRQATVSSSSYQTLHGEIRSTTTSTNSTSIYSNTVGKLSTTNSIKAVDAIRLSALTTNDGTIDFSKLSTTTQLSTDEAQTEPPFVRGKLSNSDVQLSSSSIKTALVTDSSVVNDEQTSPADDSTISNPTTKALQQPSPKVSSSITETLTTSSDPKALQISTESSTKATASSPTNISKIKTELSNSVKSELKSTSLLNSKIKNIPLVNSNKIIKPHIHETKKVVETIKQMELDVDKKHETDPPQNFYDSFFPGLLHSPENKENMLQSSLLTTTGKQV